MSTHLPTAAQAKALAKRLRAKMSGDGSSLGHAQSLERIAHQYGFRDWNTMSAAIAKAPQHAWMIGDRVTGEYLSQPFKAHILSVSETDPGWYQVELQLEAAVDVVTSEHFSNHRKRIRGVIGPKGHSTERTSDGAPHLQVFLDDKSRA